MAAQPLVGVSLAGGGWVKSWFLSEISFPYRESGVRAELYHSGTGKLVAAGPAGRVRFPPDDAQQKIMCPILSYSVPFDAAHGVVGSGKPEHSDRHGSGYFQSTLDRWHEACQWANVTTGKKRRHGRRVGICRTRRAPGPGQRPVFGGLDFGVRCRRRRGGTIAEGGLAWISSSAGTTGGFARTS